MLLFEECRLLLKLDNWAKQGISLHCTFKWYLSSQEAAAVGALRPKVQAGPYHQSFRAGLLAEVPEEFASHRAGAKELHQEKG